MHDDEFSSAAAHDSAAAIWAPLRPFIAAEARLATCAARKPWTAALYEFLRFGVKQAYACLFGGIAVALMLLTWKFYPAHAPLAHYDFLFFCMLAVQAMLLALRLETWEEAKVILVYHLVGTAMELFKTATGSWIYPEPSLFRISGVPLFSGFMYSCIGSYLCRVWRLFDFRFTHHPPRRWLIGLSAVIYLNFFLDHYGFDLRLVLFVVSALMIGPATVHFRVWRVHRAMPLLLGLLLVSLFIWLSENIGTFTRVWLYPQQEHGWAMVPPAKLGSWFLLVIISYTLVSLINRPRGMEVREEGAIAQQPEREAA
ncbi:DUF817 domain-containing protein [Bradyrhizobium sp. SZCCHNR2035]|uniref:DUF817 domain-containing protein n=1 Tax=Bradyrhizobium sp. SZCCHNR2035 TaxID=3057386 RepID=UPI002915F79C|nr:DUF817 domain-containing protein [Bradyrhizobium sp. SZCCHNR2035]